MSNIALYILFTCTTCRWWLYNWFSHFGKYQRQCKSTFRGDTLHSWRRETLLSSHGLQLHWPHHESDIHSVTYNWWWWHLIWNSRNIYATKPCYHYYCHKVWSLWLPASIAHAFSCWRYISHEHEPSASLYQTTAPRWKPVAYCLLELDGEWSFDVWPGKRLSSPGCWNR